MVKKQTKTVRKKVRININSIDELENAMKDEGYDAESFKNLSAESFKRKISHIFNIRSSVIDEIYSSIIDSDITYRVDDVIDFIDYMEKITEHEKQYENFMMKISKIDRFHIDRIEYDRKPSIQENVEHMIDSIEYVKNNMCGRINKQEKLRLDELESEINEDYIYSKDIELLKKIVISDEETTTKTYDVDSCNKTIYIEVPKNINRNYIKLEKGSVEYHEHISRNIPRIKRLIKNMHKYMNLICDEEGKTICNINQSKTLQDSINIAVAVYNNKEFKAISGSDEIKDYCCTPLKEESTFKSCKVNRLGKLGIGYNRIYDSEKKILEEIHRLIEAKEIDDVGNLVMYSKWEPCPSCYYVISQFFTAHPKIKISIKFDKTYGN